MRRSLFVYQISAAVDEYVILPNTKINLHTNGEYARVVVMQKCSLFVVLVRVFQTHEAGVQMANGRRWRRRRELG